MTITVFHKVCMVTVTVVSLAPRLSLFGLTITYAWPLNSAQNVEFKGHAYIIAYTRRESLGVRLDKIAKCFFCHIAIICHYLHTQYVCNQCRRYVQSGSVQFPNWNTGVCEPGTNSLQWHCHFCGELCSPSQTLAIISTSIIRIPGMLAHQ